MTKKSISFSLVARQSGERSTRVIAVDDDGKITWCFDIPDASDEFTQLESDEAVVKAWSWFGYLYTLGSEDGELLSTEFVK